MLRLIAVVVAVALPVTVFVQSGAVEPRSLTTGGREWSTVMGDRADRYFPLDQIGTGCAYVNRDGDPAETSRLEAA